MAAYNRAFHVSFIHISPQPSFVSLTLANLIWHPHNPKESLYLVWTGLILKLLTVCLVAIPDHN